jgi:mono/diheme cytochrome c family protein
MRFHVHKPKHKLLLMAAGASALLLTGVLIGFVILLSGAVSTEATKQHFWITHRLLDVGLRLSVAESAQSIRPPALDSQPMIEQGLACFQTFCVQCHGAPGTSRETHAQGLLPTASDLAQSARDLPANWLYYVTKKGVRMTGMPAWEYRIADDALWATVAFLKQLPRLGREQYADLASRARSSECPRSEALPPGNAGAESGKTVLLQYSCHACHRIEGVVGPDVYVGPPLVDWSRRKYIAGVVPNTPANLVRWIVDPHAISPDTLMPDLGVSQAHARAMADYLFSIE